MTTDDEPPSSNTTVPSTSSTSPLTVACDSESEDLTRPSSSIIPSFLTLNFDKLSLDSDLCEGRYDQDHSPPGPQSPTRDTQQNMPPTAENPQYYRATASKRGRFAPYDVPFKLRFRRRRKVKVSTTKSTDIEVLIKIKLKGDVEPLRMCIFDKEQILLPKPCGVQAACPPSSTTQPEEVDELSEYFTHFVRVELKMSSLAESMYV
ncbi:unnamed protein product [Caenorhabditis nigoni]